LQTKPDNHKPELSSDIAPSTARLKQSTRDGSFNLGFDDKGDKYTFNGARTTNDGQYVLIFDPARKVLVLHRLDSLFHMNVTRTPDNSDPEALRKEFPHLEISQSSSAGSGSGSSSAPGKHQKSPERGGGRSTTAAKGKEKTTSALRNPKDTARKPDKTKTVSLTLPDPAKAAPPAATSKPRARAANSDEEDEDDDDDDDGGLTIEYPGGGPSSTDFSPAFPAQISLERRFSDFVRNGGEMDEDEDADADAELDDEDAPGEEEEEEEEEAEADDEEEDDVAQGGDGGARLDAFALPSPVNNGNSNIQQQPQPNALGLQQYGGQPYAAAGYASGEDADADLEADLEAELEREFQKARREIDNDSESSVSEED